MRPSRRHVLPALTCLLLGAAVTFGVAWGCAIAGPDPRRSISGRGDGPPFVTTKGAFKWHVRRTDGFGVRERDWTGGIQVPDTYAVQLAAGWPLHALQHQSAGPGDLYQVRGIYYLELSPRRIVELPVAPIWHGLLIDIALYASLSWLALFGPGALRRHRRRRHDRCTSCGYHLAGMETCSECGSAAHD